MKRILILLLAILFVVPLHAANTHFLLMGSPGSGKGTLTQLLMKSGEYEHLCLGDLLRREIDLQTPLGAVFDEYVKCGDLVPNELLFSFFEGHFQDALASNKKLIIDGMVQSRANVQFFDTLLEKYGLVDDFNYVYLHVDKEVALERLLGRMICEKCGTISKENDSLSCEHCQGILVKRMDDCSTTIQRRIKRFFESTIYLIENYRDRAGFFEIDGNLELNVLSSQYFHLFMKKS